MILAEPLHIAPPLHCHYLKGRNATLVLSFSGVGEDDEAVPRVEAARLSGWQGENHVLFIADESRSWMNAPDLLAQTIVVVSDLRASIGAQRVVAIGNSMGGSAALIFAAHFPLNAVLAISPQFSVHPDLIPKEDRWTRFASRIQDWPHPSVPDLSDNGAQVMILHGGRGKEMRHAHPMAQGPNIHHYIFPGSGHSLAYGLHRRNQLEPISTPLISGDLPKACLAAEAANGVRYSDFTRLQQAATAEEAQL